MNIYQIYRAIELAQKQKASANTIRPLGYLLQASLESLSSSISEEEMRNARELADLGTGYTSFKSHW